MCGSVFDSDSHPYTTNTTTSKVHDLIVPRDRAEELVSRRSTLSPPSFLGRRRVLGRCPDPEAPLRLGDRPADRRVAAGDRAVVGGETAEWRRPPRHGLCPLDLAEN